MRLAAFFAFATFDVDAVVFTMIEILERTITASRRGEKKISAPSEPVSVLRREVFMGVGKNDPFVLPLGTRGFVSVETAIPNGTEVVFLGPIRLINDLEVALIAMDEGAGSLQVTLDSGERRGALRGMYKAGYDLDVIAAEDMGRMKAERRLAQEFIGGLTDHSLDPSHIRRVDLVVGIA